LAVGEIGDHRIDACIAKGQSPARSLHEFCTPDIFPAAGDHERVDIASNAPGTYQYRFKDNPPRSAERIKQSLSRSDKRDIDQCPGQAGHHHPGVEEGAAARSPQFIRRPFPMEDHLPKIAPVPGKDRPVLTAGIIQVHLSPYYRSNAPFKIGDRDIPG